MSLLEITGLSHTYGDNRLYGNAGLTLNKGEHMGIVGPNGAGKSTLIRLCTQQVIPDEGRIVWQPGIRVGYLDQYAALDGTITMREFLKKAFEDLYQMEHNMILYYEEAANGDMKHLRLAAQYQEQLEYRGFYTIDSRLEQAASGLGLLELGLDCPVVQMSGGQRARVILARLLLEQPDFHFPEAPLTATEHLTVRRLSVGYDHPVLSDLSFSVTGGQKIVITGFN